MSEQTEDNRYYLFDNMRAVSIILVVLGHMLTSLIFSYDVIKIIYYFIYFLHMPAMVFISGYFSKDVEKSRNKAFETILMPYLILNVCSYIFKMLILREQYFGFRFFRPLWGLWYLLVLFLWKFFLKDLVKIRFILPLSFLVGLLSGFSKEFSTYMALGRLVCFLPFFLLGYYIKKEHIEKIRRIPKAVSLLVFIAAGALSVFIVKQDIFDVENLYLRSPYPEESDIEHMAYRALIYVVALFMIFALIIITSDRKNFLTNVGQSTLTVYVLHLFTIPLLEKLEILYDRPYMYLIYTIVITAIICYIYSRPIVKKTYDKAMNGLVNLILKNKNKSLRKNGAI
mgnify:CR=1 FL=1